MRKNYVIIPGTRMAGLFSYVLQAIQNLTVVDGTENKLFIKYNENMLYLDPRVGGNVWDYYFHQPFQFTKEEIINHPKEQAIFIENENEIFKYLGLTLFLELRSAQIHLETRRILCQQLIHHFQLFLW